MKKSSAFTLAEVLITLGIIGVVAAMTIPNLIANTNGAKYRSGFKKAISTLSQAGLMAQAQYDFDYAGTSSSGYDCGTDHPESNMTMCAIFNGTLTGQTYRGLVSDIKMQKQSSAGSSSTAYSIARYHVLFPSNFSGMHAYTLADGSIVGFDVANSGCTLETGNNLYNVKSSVTNCLGFIDVNGTTLPNKEVQCSDGVTTDWVGKSGVTDCYVKNNANDMTDIFPIVFHDSTVEPASNAAKYVLTTSK
jgi:prepilin-type N-terminal cleavage/methylation domain-containing protein